MCDGSDDSQSRTKPRSIAAVTSLFTGMTKIKMSRDVYFQQCGMCDQQSLRSACANAQSDQSLCLWLEYSITVQLLTKHHLEFLSVKGGCTGWSKSTLVNMPHCWKFHVVAQISEDLNSLMLKFQKRIAQMMIPNTVKPVLSGKNIGLKDKCKLNEGQEYCRMLF